MQAIDRRQLVKGAAYPATGLVASTGLVDGAKPERVKTGNNASSFVTKEDGTRLFVQDWGRGRPVVFLSAWTFHSNVWGSHIAALTARGFRCIAPDRRGHGRSDAPTPGTI